MKLFLSQVDTTWKGLVDIEGETFKVTLLPGSATEDWKAVLEVGGWVELSSDGKIADAIRTALLDQERLEQPILKPQEQAILEALQEQPQLMDEILKAISPYQDEGPGLNEEGDH